MNEWAVMGIWRTSLSFEACDDIFTLNHVMPLQLLMYPLCTHPGACFQVFICNPYGVAPSSGAKHAFFNHTGDIRTFRSILNRYFKAQIQCLKHTDGFESYKSIYPSIKLNMDQKIKT